MCGIVGQIELQGIVDPAAFVAMRDALAHRGPDDAGTWISADGSTRYRGVSRTPVRHALATTKIDQVHQLARKREFPLKCSLEEA